MVDAVDMVDKRDAWDKWDRWDNFFQDYEWSGITRGWQNVKERMRYHHEANVMFWWQKEQW